MQAKKRYILVVLSCAFLAYCYFGGYRIKRLLSLNASKPEQLPTFVVLNPSQINYHSVRRSRDVPAVNDRRQQHVIIQRKRSRIDILSSNNQQHRLNETLRNEHDIDDLISMPAAHQLKNDHRKVTNTMHCTMETCFDFSKCYDDFLVYVYPPEPLNSLGATLPVSANYQKLLTAITESRYYTADPERACLFVLAIDTLDRDSLSEDMARNVPQRLQRVPHWNNGRNHIIFNLYAGETSLSSTWMASMARLDNCGNIFMFLLLHYPLGGGKASLLWVG